MTEPTQLDGYEFDARNYNPDQGGAIVPAGKYPLVITNTENKKTKDGKGVRFVVELTVAEGPSAGNKVYAGYNLINENAEAQRIAHQQLSALCHAVGIYQVSMRNQGAALRGARLMADVIVKTGNEGPMNDVKRVYDAYGNEPGKAGGQPMTQPGPQPGMNTQPGPQPYQPQPNPAYPPQPAPAPQAGPATWGPQPAPGPTPGQPAPAWGAPAGQPQPQPAPQPAPGQWAPQPQPQPGQPPQQWQGQPTQPAAPQPPQPQQGWQPGGQPTGPAPAWAGGAPR